MIAFSRTFSWDVKTLSSSFLAKSQGIHQSSRKFLCLIVVAKVANLLLTFVTCMIFFHVCFMSFWALDEVIVEVMVSMGIC